MKTTSSFLDLPQSGIRRMYDLAKNKKLLVGFILSLLRLLEILSRTSIPFRFSIDFLTVT